jgi:hypothetical protein
MGDGDGAFVLKSKSNSYLDMCCYHLKCMDTSNYNLFDFKRSGSMRAMGGSSSSIPTFDASSRAPICGQEKCLAFYPTCLRQKNSLK